MLKQMNNTLGTPMASQKGSPVALAPSFERTNSLRSNLRNTNSISKEIKENGTVETEHLLNDVIS